MSGLAGIGTDGFSAGMLADEMDMISDLLEESAELSGRADTDRVIRILPL